MTIDSVICEEPVLSEECIATKIFNKEVLVPVSAYDNFQTAIREACPAIDALHQLKERMFRLDTTAQVLFWGSMIAVAVDISDKSWDYIRPEAAAFALAPAVAIVSALLYNYGIRTLNRNTPPLSLYAINRLYLSASQ